MLATWLVWAHMHNVAMIILQIFSQYDSNREYTKFPVLQTSQMWGSIHILFVVLQSDKKLSEQAPSNMYIAWKLSEHVDSWVQGQQQDHRQLAGVLWHGHKLATQRQNTDAIGGWFWTKNLEALPCEMDIQRLEARECQYSFFFCLFFFIRICNIYIQIYTHRMNKQRKLVQSSPYKKKRRSYIKQHYR